MNRASHYAEAQRLLERAASMTPRNYALEAVARAILACAPPEVVEKVRLAEEAMCISAEVSDHV